MSETIVLAGGGRHALSLGSLLEDSGCTILGYTDPKPTGLRWAYMGTDTKFISSRIAASTSIVVAVGIDTRLRQQIFRRYRSAHLKILTFVHPDAYVASSASLGLGCVLFPHTYVGAKARLGQNVTLCAGAVVDHESVIGDHSYLSPGTTIAGKVTAGSCCIFGLNSTVMESIRLADHICLGAASFLLRSVDKPEQTLVGIPAIPIGK